MFFYLYNNFIMAEIVLTTINARYIHASFGLRWLLANLRELQSQACIQEYSLSDQITDVAEKILAVKPTIVGIGVYIWNAAEVRQLVRIIKRVAPQICVVLGGPEVSHQPLRVDFSEADYIIAGEGEVAFYRLCLDLLHGRQPGQSLITAEPPEVDALTPPYALYTEEDLAHRLLYVEASRGCPFTCEFCLSSIDRRVRPYAIQRFLAELEALWQRGARTFKFVDRTFNSNLAAAETILDFFLAKQPPFHAHFEVIPDHFPEAIKERLRLFPAGTLQLEVGVQTLDPQTSATINRRLDFGRIKENLSYLETETTAHLHVDLIVGLPGESLAQFGHNLDTLVDLTHGEIQVGILKKLSGTSLHRHDQQYGMIYSPDPPYEILQNDLIPYAQMQTMKRFARFWDLLYNSGNFPRSVPLLWPDKDVFHRFFDFTCWLYGETRATWQIGLPRLAELLFRYLVEIKGYKKSDIANHLAADILVIKGRTLPAAIQQHITQQLETRHFFGETLTKRQSLRLKGAAS